MSMATRIHSLKPRGSPGETRFPGPARWEQFTAWGAFICTVPSALWRVLMIMGLLPGTTDLRAAHAGEHGYVWALSLVQLATGFLAVGLVRPWGERIRGTAVPRWLPIGAGALGGIAVTYLFTVSILVGLARGARPDQGLVHGAPLLVMLVCYAPTVLWGPLELAAVAGFASRTASSRRQRGSADPPGRGASQSDQYSDPTPSDALTKGPVR